MLLEHTINAFASIRDEGFSEHEDDELWSVVQRLFDIVGSSPECANLADAIESDTGQNDESSSIIATTILVLEACASMNDSGADHRPIHNALLAHEAAALHHS